MSLNLDKADLLAIEAVNLRKEYDNKVAVDDLSLQIQAGEVFGFLGPNGAGKTTSVKMLLGLVRPTSGTGFILGSPIGEANIRAQVGFLPEHFRFHGWLTGEEFLGLHGNLYGMPAERLRVRVVELLALVGLGRHSKKKLSAYSKGMLQRIGLAQALLNDPALVILDEPTSGLDPLGRRLVRDIVRDLREEGKTVFINSHLLSEIEITCDRVAFIKHGVVVEIANLSDMANGKIRVQARVKNLSEQVRNGLKVWTEDIEVSQGLLKLGLSDEEKIPEIHRYLVENAVDVYSFKPENRSLEDIFVSIMADDGSDL